MDKHTEDEALTKALLQELPMSKEMPSHVRTKALNIAVEANRKAQSARRPRTVAWFTAGIAVVAAAAFMMPRPAAAKTWTLVTQAVQKITSVQMDVKMAPEKGKAQHVFLAVQNGKMSVDSGEGHLVYIDREGIQAYDRSQNTITKMIIPAIAGEFLPDVAAEIVKSFDLKKTIADMEKQYGKDHIRIGQIRQQDGRDVYDVQMTEPNGPGQCFMTIDASTDLPIYIDAKQTQNTDVEDGGTFVVELRYNDQFEIKPNFPADAKVVTLDLANLESQGKAMEKAFGDMFKDKK